MTRKKLLLANPKPRSQKKPERAIVPHISTAMGPQQSAVVNVLADALEASGHRVYR